ncbi:MAG: L-threonylcarbamoyladenylate synthase [Anderseniella sp.]
MSHVTTDIEAAATALREGKLVAFATETVYGLGADATNGKAVASVFEAKGRPSFNPLIVHVVSVAEVEKLGVLNDHARKLASALWPGPLTLVLPRTPDCPISRLASAGLKSIAIRVPGHHQAQQLLQLAGKPIAAPSANISGQISPTTAAHVTAGLGDSIWGVLDGGPCEIGLESTIVSCLSDEPIILRPGGITEQQLSDVLGQKITTQHGSTNDPISPGQLESHYAPNAQVRLNVKEPEPGEAYLAFGKKEPEAFIIRNLSPQKDLREAAANLFAMLHTLDMLGAESIAVAPIPDEGLGIAINDRLKRAAAPREPE